MTSTARPPRRGRRARPGRRLLTRWGLAVLTGLLTVLTCADAGTAAGQPTAPRPAAVPLRILTLPPVVGFPITVGTERVLTDRAGVAHFKQLRTSRLDPTDIRTADTEVQVGDKRVQVRPTRIQLGSDVRILVSLYFATELRFATSGGEPVPPTAVGTVTLKSSTGEVINVPPDDPVWLHGVRVVSLANGQVPKKLTWTVQRVDFAGSNVVNTSQQRFDPADTQVVTVSMLFYRARIRVHDAFFGFRRSGTIELVYPDRTSRTLTLDADGEVLVPSLPRGSYQVRLDTGGPPLVQPVAISTDQDLDLKYYTWLDLTVVLVVGLFLTVGLVTIGVRRRRAHDRRTASP